jgi:hypothetical protein
VCQLATAHGRIQHTNYEIHHPGKIAGIRKSKAEVYCLEQFFWRRQEQHSVTLPLTAQSLFVNKTTVVQIVSRASGGLMCVIGRTTLRFNIHIPARIRRLGRVDAVEHGIGASNLSTAGRYFSRHTQLELDTPIRACLRMPEQIFGKPIVRWCCDGRVVHLGLSADRGTCRA